MVDCVNGWLIVKWMLQIEGAGDVCMLRQLEAL